MRPSQNLVIGWLVVMLALAWFIGAHSEPPMPCIDEASREKARALMLEAIDEALKDHTKHIFDVWMKDYTQEQPLRAITGMRQGIIAYNNSRNATLRWSPPICPPKS